MSDILAELREKNPTLDIRSAEDESFSEYGRIVDSIDFSELICYLREHTPIEEGSHYLASDAGAEKLPVYEEIRRRIFGCTDIQIGWCNGTNRLLNGLEWHSSIEINVAANDIVLLLAKLSSLKNGKIDSSEVRGFLVRAGQAVLLDSSTLHLAPCAVHDGFRVAVILPRGTNTPLIDRKDSELPLWMKNKWLLAHGDAEHLVKAGARVGLCGERIKLAGLN